MADRGAKIEPQLRPLRAAAANLRAAAETLEAFPEMEIVRRTRLLQILVEEAERLSAALGELEISLLAPAESAARGAAVTDIVAAIDRECDAVGLAVEVAPIASATAQRVVRAPARQLARAIAEFARGLGRAGIERIGLSGGAVEGHCKLDLSWSPNGDSDDASTWAAEALEGVGGEEIALRPLLREVGGEAWVALERDGRAAHLRLLLPFVPPAREA